MNRIRPTPPIFTPTTQAFGTPPWLVVGMRCLLLLAGCAAAILLAQHGSAMPWPALLLAASLAPALIASAVWPRPWRYTTNFIADEHGMYFPAYPPLRLSIQPGPLVEWLEVPWKHITNIRVAREAGEGGKCVAFDVQACAAERSRFFEAVGTPRDRRGPSPANVSAAYGGWPPAPERVVQQLLSLRLCSAASGALKKQNAPHSENRSG